MDADAYELATLQKTIAELAALDLDRIMTLHLIAVDLLTAARKRAEVAAHIAAVRASYAACGETDAQV